MISIIDVRSINNMSVLSISVETISHWLFGISRNTRHWQWPLTCVQYAVSIINYKSYSRANKRNLRSLTCELCNDARNYSWIQEFIMSQRRILMSLTCEYCDHALYCHARDWCRLLMRFSRLVLHNEFDSLSNIIGVLASKGCPSTKDPIMLDLSPVSTKHFQGVHA